MKMAKWGRNSGISFDHALIFWLHYWSFIFGQARVVRSEEDPWPVFVQNDEMFTLSCRADQSLRYCWFQHPNGTQYTPVEHTSDDQTFWYKGESLQSGECGITFSHASIEDSGEWICHMGPRTALGMELTDRLEVIVSGALAAMKKNISVNIGDSVNLYCLTANERKPLDYCRFLSPTFVGINIDDSITEENAINGHYYFTPERRLNRGDCALTIKNVRPHDIGEWTCAALITRDTIESRDTIELQYTQFHWIREPLGQASIVGMSVGFSILAVAIVGFVVIKRFGLPPWSTISQSKRDILSMTSDVTSTGRSSMGDSFGYDADRRNHLSISSASSGESFTGHPKNQP